MSTSARLIITLIMLVCLPSPATERSFIIRMAGFKIGRLQAYHIRNNGFDYYVTHSAVDFSVLLRVKADVRTEALYNDGMLLKATVTSSLNGVSYQSKTVWCKDHYNINCHTYKYDYVDSTLTKPIHWTASKLYFEIPEAGDEIYTESYGKLGVMTACGNHALKMSSPKSKQTYYYNAGKTKLLKIEVINNIKNFDMYPDSTR